MKDVTLITAMHGDEYMPVLALASWGIPQLVANPRALARRVRYTESDLNAAFGNEVIDYETGRATEMLGQIPESNRVVDFHSFSCTGPAFAIIVDPAQLDLARRTGLNHIVRMVHNIKKGHALINYRNGVSVEVGQHDTESSFQTTLDVVRSIESGEISGDAILYEVYDTIKEPGEYENLVLHTDGYYPVLGGEKAYAKDSDYYGLKARKVASFAL